MYSQNRCKKKKKSVFLFLFLILIFLGGIFFLRILYISTIYFYPGTKIEIKKGDNFSKFYNHLSVFHRFMIKLWMKNNVEILPKLQEGTYYLSGIYKKSDFFELIAHGPELNHQKLTFLEGWSIYDIDLYLSQKLFFSQGTYIQKVQDQNFIKKMRSEFSFLSILPEGKSLEGFLYPDTYFFDIHHGNIEQLIKMQLKNFENKVWNQYRDLFLTFTPQGLDLMNYRALILASVIENEEKNIINKPFIAGIFINRLLAGMRLDADITLCYGLAIPYSKCKSVIADSLNDATNLYNTRKNIGLMPTPISSPTISTFQALFNYQPNSAIFYLHDKQGNIYYGATLEEHNQNKIKYLSE